MMGLDGTSIALIALALSLMTVSPLHLTIARSKVKSVPITAVVEDDNDDPVNGPDNGSGTTRTP